MLINGIILPFCDLCYIFDLYKMYLLIYVNVEKIQFVDTTTNETTEGKTMKGLKNIAIAAMVAGLVGCADMPKRECTAIYQTGGNEYAVAVFGVADVGGHKMVKAGYPFNFQWVSVDHFKKTDCPELN